MTNYVPQDKGCHLRYQLLSEVLDVVWVLSWVLLHSYLSFMTDWEVNVKRRPVRCLNTRRIKYVYIAATKGVCHAAYDWYWHAVQAARWGALSRFSMRVEGSAFLQQPTGVSGTLLAKGCSSKTHNVLGMTQWHCTDSAQHAILNV